MHAKINIIGDGSMGHLWSGYLSRAKIPNQLYSHSDKPAYQVTLSAPSFKYEFRSKPLALSCLTSDAAAIVCVKAPALKSVLEQLVINQCKPKCLVLMMNGLGLIELAQQKSLFPVYQAATTQAARLSRSNDNSHLIVKHTGLGQTQIGDIQPSVLMAEQQAQSNMPPPHGQADQTRAQVMPLVNQLNQALPEVVWSDNHLQNLHIKLLVNTLINPLTAIHNVENGEIANNLKLKQKLYTLAKELEPMLPVLVGKHFNWQNLADKALQVAQLTAKNSSSMRQDILMGRKTEIDFITGYILNKATLLGCCLPEHEKLFKQIKRLELQTQTSVTN